MKIKVLHKYRLRIQLITINLMIAFLAIFIIGGGSSVLYYKEVTSHIDNTTDIYFSEVSEQLSDYYIRLQSLSDAVFYTEAFQEMVSGQGVNYEEYINFDLLLTQYMSLEKSISDIYFMGTTKTGNYFLRDIADMYKIYNSIVEYETKNSPFDNELSIVKLIKADGQYLFGVRQINGFIAGYETYLEEIGLGIIMLREDSLKSILVNSNMPKTSEIYLVDENNHIIESTVSDLDTETFDKNSYTKSFIIKSSSVEGMNPPMELICLIPKNSLYGDINKYVMYLIMAMVIILLITFVSSISFNYRLTKPLKELADTFDRVAKGDLKSRLKFDYENEITTIEQNFNNMMQDIYTLNKNIVNNQEILYQAELDKKQFQYMSLQNQIKSHFLYNTLSMIRAMAFKGEKRVLGELINRLVAYLRYTAKEQVFVSIKDELDHLHNYIYIQQKRFGRKIIFKYKVEAGLEQVEILKLLLQPLVENAVSHGLKECSSRGIICVNVTSEKQQICVKVMDNGMGLSQEELARVRELLKVNQKDLHHIGLQNIQRRIQLEYGEEYRLHIKSWKDIGTILSFKLPYKNR